MPHHIVAWSESQDPGGAYVGVAAVADQTAITSGDILYVPEIAPNLVGAMANIGATNPAGAYLQSPSLRARLLYDILPCNNALKPVTGEECTIHPTNPIPLAVGEGLEAYINSDPAAAEQGSVVAILSDGPLLPVTGEILSVRVSAGITETAGVWKSGSITFRQTLPVGRYQLVGSQWRGTSGVAFRYILKGAAHRPGGPCVSAIQYPGLSEMRNGNLGVWGEFHSLTPPDLEWLASATSGTAQYGVMDLIRVA